MIWWSPGAGVPGLPFSLIPGTNQLNAKANDMPTFPGNHTGTLTAGPHAGCEVMFSQVRSITPAQYHYTLKFTMCPKMPTGCMCMIGFS